MIVTDASAVVEMLTRSRPPEQLVDMMTTEDLAAPHLVDAEVLNTLRGLLLGGKLDEATCETSRRDYADLTIHRYRIDAISDRIWELRHNFNAYDASYIALAEALDVPMVTCDAKLRPTSAVHDAQVHVFA